MRPFGSILSYGFPKGVFGLYDGCTAKNGGDAAKGSLHPLMGRNGAIQEPQPSRRPIARFLRDSASRWRYGGKMGKYLLSVNLNGGCSLRRIGNLCGCLSNTRRFKAI